MLPWVAEHRLLKVSRSGRQESRIVDLVRKGSQTQAFRRGRPRARCVERQVHWAGTAMGCQERHHQDSQSSVDQERGQPLLSRFKTRRWCGLEEANDVRVVSLVTELISEQRCSILHCCGIESSRGIFGNGNCLADRERKDWVEARQIWIRFRVPWA